MAAISNNNNKQSTSEQALIPLQPVMVTLQQSPIFSGVYRNSNSLLGDVNISIIPDVWRKIAEFLDIRSIFRLNQVCRGLRGLSQDSFVQKMVLERRRQELENDVFGKAAWNTHFGDVGEVDPIPIALLKALEEPCPFTKGKKVKETHIACWIPTHVNGIPLTFKTLGKLVKKPLQGHTIRYNHTSFEAKKDHGDTPVKKGHWILLTKTVIEGSRDKNYDEQKKIVENYAGYEVPTLLPTAIALLVHHTRTGERLYDDNPWTYTRCQETCEEVGRLVMGGFVIGLGVYHYADADYVGVGGLRKF